MLTEQYLPGKKITYQQLYERNSLIEIDKDFSAFLEQTDSALFTRFTLARSQPNHFSKIEESTILIKLAPYVEEFLANLFDIQQEAKTSHLQQSLFQPIYICKRQFIQRRALKSIMVAELVNINAAELRLVLQKIFEENFCDLAFAKHTLKWLEDEKLYEANIKYAELYAAWAVLTTEGQSFHINSVLFQIPTKLDFLNLIKLEELSHSNVEIKQSPHIRYREGFGLTDKGATIEKALDQANYCIWCHNQSKDSCSTGLLNKINNDFQKNYFKESLIGCPLEQKISEMNFVKSKGLDLAALAIIIVDNPMVAATGHRICNDCMKSCIFQKQEPVNIPEVETSVLRSVLALPYGFEIYSLLTRWNPMNLRNPLPKAATGYKVLIVGLGPAGFTLAHYLMNEGHAVTAVDGLKIEPLPQEISGKDRKGNSVNFNPIKNIKEIYEKLDERIIGGFGGVAEYGITVRWDKNFLKLIRLLLERRKEFLSFGGIRFGGTLTIDQTFELGFDHIALCMGAGKPTILPLKNNLAIGVRQATDFLMALQLTGAANLDSLANLQIRLPIIVIGGGLTAIDTATEAMAYYPVQVEKMLVRYEILALKIEDEKIKAGWTEEEKIIFQEFIEHARIIRQERAQAKKENRHPNIQALIQKWGGVTIVYRRRLVDSPSYIQNHQELAHAMKEGIWFAENLTPLAIEVDKFNHAIAINFEERKNEVTSLKSLSARTVLVAAGTVPNTILAKEDTINLTIDGYHFQTLNEEGNIVNNDPSCKTENVQLLAAIRKDKRAISFFGDLHPSFSGNVVKAMASAKRGYPTISRMLNRLSPQPSGHTNLWNKLNHDLLAVIYGVQRLAPTIIEIILHAPFAAKAFRPGQFYRLQNFKVDALKINNTSLLFEGLALTGAGVDKEKGLISTIVLENGGSSNLCKLLKVGQPVILMGPTGEPTYIPSNETVLLAGGGLGNAVLFSIGQALRNSSCKVLYFAAYKKIDDRYKVEEIIKAADQIIWCCEETPGFSQLRPNDINFIGNIVEAMQAYAKGEIGFSLYPFKTINRIIVIGSDEMMKAVNIARNTILKTILNPHHIGIGSINSPMQCMMKEICGQCLQRHYDPITKQEKIVFSCSNQDQNLDVVDFTCLNNRLKQNSLQEKLTNLWVGYCLDSLVE